MQNEQNKKSEEGDGSTFIGRQKIVSFENMRDKGIVELRLLDEFHKTTSTGKKLQQSVVSARVFTDPATGIHYGVPLKKRKDGTVQFKRIVVEHGTTYNLEDVTDRETWHVVQFWPQIKGSLLDTHGVAHFEVFDKDIAAQRSIEEYKRKRDAEDYIMALDDEGLLDFALAFHIDTTTNSNAVIRHMLMELCSQKVDGKNVVLEHIRNKEHLRVVIAFRRSIVTGLTSFTSTGYLYKNNVPLGTDESASIEFLKANKTILNAIDAESKVGIKAPAQVRQAQAATPERLLAQLKSKAMQLGIPKYWMLEAGELQTLIEEKETKKEDADKSADNLAVAEATGKKEEVKKPVKATAGKKKISEATIETDVENEEDDGNNF